MNKKSVNKKININEMGLKSQYPEPLNLIYNYDRAYPGTNKFVLLRSLTRPELGKAQPQLITWIKWF